MRRIIAKRTKRLIIFAIIQHLFFLKDGVTAVLFMHRNRDGKKCTLCGYVYTI